MKVKRDVRNSILPSLTFGSETLEMELGTAVKSGCCKRSYIRGVCEVTGWGKSNETVYKRCSMNTCANEMKCGMMEWVKSNTLKWFGRVRD